MLCVRLNYRKDEIVRQMNQMIKNFDSQLLCLRHEKVKLEIALKKAQFMFVASLSRLRHSIHRRSIKLNMG